MYQLVHTSRPGTLDTSLVSTDYINNPRTMNAIYNLGPRLDLAKRWGKETLAGGELNNKQFNDFYASGPLTQFFQPPNTSWTPRVLKDGVGFGGRAGCAEPGLPEHRPVQRGMAAPLQPAGRRAGRSRPSRSPTPQTNSSYWQATEQQTPLTALFFLKAGAAGSAQGCAGRGQVPEPGRGRAWTGARSSSPRRCARCHSSKAPEPAVGRRSRRLRRARTTSRAGTSTGPGPRPTNTRRKMRADRAGARLPRRQLPVDRIAGAGDPAADQRLQPAGDQRASPATSGTTSRRRPTRTCRRSARSPSTTRSPARQRQYEMPAGGRGYTRPPSLISLWSTAPFLLEQQLSASSIRTPRSMPGWASFQDGIEQMLWPEKRAKDPVLGDKIPGIIDRTTAQSYLTIPAGFLPDMLVSLLKPFRDELPWLLTDDGDIQLGPIPKGTPVDLSPTSICGRTRCDLVDRVKHDFKLAQLRDPGSNAICTTCRPTPATSRPARRSRNLVPAMLELSKCPDFVVNRGHYFGTDRFAEEPGLSDPREARPDRVPQDVLGGQGRPGRLTRRRPSPAEHAVRQERRADERGGHDGRVRVRGRRIGRRRRHGRRAAGRSGQEGDAAGSRWRSSRAQRRRRRRRGRQPTARRLRRAGLPSASRPRTRRCAGTSSSATTTMTRSKSATPNTASRPTAGRLTASSIRARAPSVAAPRTMR